MTLWYSPLISRGSTDKTIIIVVKYSSIILIGADIKFNSQSIQSFYKEKGLPCKLNDRWISHNYL